VLDGEEAKRLRSVLAEHENGRVPSERGPVRGLSRLLRRNPTDAERSLWDGLTKDRRFAGLGFKRHTPVGSHIPDLVSFPLRTVIEIVPEEEGEAAISAREKRRAWLEQRGYRVVDVAAQAIETDCASVIEDLFQRVGGDPASAS
jgi:tRNA/rRNA methyltransferase